MTTSWDRGVLCTNFFEKCLYKGDAHEIDCELDSIINDAWDRIVSRSRRSHHIDDGGSIRVFKAEAFEAPYNPDELYHSTYVNIVKK